MKDVHINIVTLDSREHVLACLDSLYRSTGLEFHITVVDNNSHDGTPDAIRQQFPQTELIVNKENAGFARAVNQTLGRKDSRYHLILNPDTLVLDDMLRELIGFMEAHPRAGVCTPKVLNRDGTLQYQCRRGEARPWEVFSYFSGLARLFPRDPRFTGYLLTHLDENETCEVKAVSGSCMLVRREVIDQIGLLDERFFAYQEDADFCFRARRAGWKVYYVPSARVVHYGGRGGSGRRPYLGIYHWHRSYYLYYRKNLKHDYPFWFHPIYYAAMGVKLVSSLLVAWISPIKIVGTKKP
jgi:hypothetical protein